MVGGLGKKWKNVFFYFFCNNQQSLIMIDARVSVSIAGNNY